MGFISKLFGGGSNPSVAPPPPSPRIGDAASEGAARQEASRLKRRKGVDDSILSSGLGDTGGQSQITRTTLGS